MRGINFRSEDYRARGPLLCLDSETEFIDLCRSAYTEEGLVTLEEVGQNVDEVGVTIIS
jgi:hypothetical protein